ncbi:MAG: HepT-like ribonuclease domain-containing protein [Pirellulales bacterium]
MTRHDPRARLRHMLDHAQEAVEMLGDKTEADVAQDRKLELALVRLVEVVGEAAAQVPTEFRDAYPELPWREATSMRNMLIHGYDLVRYDILCNTIRYDLPPLIEQLKETLATLGDT